MWRAWAAVRGTDEKTNRRIGWAVSAVNDRHLTIKALDIALKRRCPEAGLLHHSDQGCTYASEDYQKALAARGIQCSMSRKGNCWDNAVVESFFATLTKELLLDGIFETRAEASRALFEFIEIWYNRQRRHSTLGYRTPVEFEEQVLLAG